MTIDCDNKIGQGMMGSQWRKIILLALIISIIQTVIGLFLWSILFAVVGEGGIQGVGADIAQIITGMLLLPWLAARALLSAFAEGRTLWVAIGSILIGSLFWGILAACFVVVKRKISAARD